MVPTIRHGALSARLRSFGRRAEYGPIDRFPCDTRTGRWHRHSPGRHRYGGYVPARRARQMDGPLWRSLWFLQPLRPNAGRLAHRTRSAAGKPGHGEYTLALGLLYQPACRPGCRADASDLLAL